MQREERLQNKDGITSVLEDFAGGLCVQAYYNPTICVHPSEKFNP